MEEEVSVRVGGSENWIVFSREQVGAVEVGSGVGVWSLAVELHGQGLTARTSIWLGPAGVEEPLSDFFRRLAEDWRGWEGTRSWVGMEGGLDLHCVNDGVSTAHVTVVLRHLSGADWTVQAVVPVDLGQLDLVADGFHRLLAV